MKSREFLSSDKMRGGFYSPTKLVDICNLRALSLQNSPQVRILEPSCGDGAFIEGLARTPICDSVDLLGIEIISEEAEKAKAALRRNDIKGSILCASFFEAYDELNEYDVVLGNPPYIRYQFINEKDASKIQEIAKSIDIDFRRVGNIWIPIVIASLSKLRVGGSFALIIPDESLAGVSASQFRRWIIDNCCDIKIDIFPPKIFPNVLQETLIISGRRGKPNNIVRFIQHFPDQPSEEWEHYVDNHDTWYRYLLDSDALDIYSKASLVVPLLSDIAKFDVSIVTGANDFFCIDKNTMVAFELDQWSEPLLSRTRDANGVIYSILDYQESVEGGKKSYILNFSEDKPNPMDFYKPAEYLKIGEEVRLHERYKCAIRQPWYRIPNMIGYQLLMSKRSHFSPKVILNESEVLTTDTIYRGRISKVSGISSRDFAATFHNSMTLLSAEIEGRNFGGGVLELVPSEVSRLRIEALVGMSSHLSAIDKVFRDNKQDTDFQEAINYTDRLIVKNNSVLSKSDLEKLGTSLKKLRNRRLERN